uniref:Uncharacterized protein n=1 Tax=Alexandrium catenella TaxID=2925 RepID=A0A7S1MKE7_ALECA
MAQGAVRGRAPPRHRSSAQQGLARQRPMVRPGLIALALATQVGGAAAAAGQLAGASCANSTAGLPGYCCDGIIPNHAFADTCECNPGWTHEECVCKGYLTAMPCHQCMVHLPGTNRWMKSFAKSELYANCADCVSRCKAEFDKGSCAQFMADVWASKFTDKDPAAVLCTNEYLKSQVTKKDYPLGMKRSLYRSPRLRADDDYHQPSDWPVEGVGGAL